MARLETGRLVLRPARADDCEALHAVFARADATRYWSTPPHADMAVTRDWLDSMLAIPPDEGEDFIVEHQGRVIGKAGFYRFPEVGFILHPDAWGRGLGFEALQAVLARGFAVHGLPRADADVDPRNAACQRLLSRLGFRETGRAERTWNVGGEWCDSVYLSLTREDWDQRTA